MICSYLDANKVHNGSTQAACGAGLQQMEMEMRCQVSKPRRMPRSERLTAATESRVYKYPIIR